MTFTSGTHRWQYWTKAGEIVEEVRVFDANLDELTQRHAGTQAAMEVTINYYHIYDSLSEYFDVTVANPGNLKLVVNTDMKTDRVGAKELARMVRMDSVPDPTFQLTRSGKLTHSCASDNS